MKKLRHFIYLILLIGLDQVLKVWGRYDLAGGNGLGGRDISLIPKVLKLTYVENTGAIFGTFKGNTLLLTILGMVILLGVLWFYFKIPDLKRYRPLQIIVVFIIAGAIGNLIDRIFYGFVTDFIYIELINFYVFNFADMYITLSEVLLIILLVFYYKSDEIDFILKSKKKQIDSKLEESNKPF